LITLRQQSPAPVKPPAAAGRPRPGTPRARTDGRVE
jgi:hypothetical protein